ncbi:hypothetical protein AAMO2058_000466400 [Amorphochlora amoebiformis]
MLLLLPFALAYGQTVRNPASVHSGRTILRQAQSARGFVPFSRPSPVRMPWSQKALDILGVRRNVLMRAGAGRREIDTSEVTVVTGGGTGIGQAAALRLAKRGMSVLVVGRREAALQETKQLAEEQGLKGKIIPVVADVTEEKGRQAVVDAVEKLAKGGATLRGLVHNAAVNTPCKRMMEIPQDEWLKVTDINVNGPLFLTQKLYPLFGKDNPERNRVMMISSVARTCTGLPAYGPYCVSKLTFYGLHLMFKEEMTEGKNPVYSASLIPGEVDTEMQRATAYGQDDGVFPENLVKYWREIQESGQLLPPEVTGAFMEYVLCDTVTSIFHLSK